MTPAPSFLDRFDVAILGGGPAGTATALSLLLRNEALKVVVVERSDYSELRVGESLPPPAQALLRKLGLWEAFLSRSPLESSGTRAAWGSPNFHENEFIYSLFGRGWHLDRRDFDAMLADEAERKGATLLRRMNAKQIDRKDHWQLRVQSGEDESTTCSLSARFIVDATGRRSSFARSQGAQYQIFDQLVGIAVFLRFAPEDRPSDTYTSVEACEHGWWYSAALPNGDMAAIFMTDAHCLRTLPWRNVEQWRALTALAPQTAKRIAKGVPIAAPMLHLAGSQKLSQSVGADWLAVGDASCTWDPLSSQGVMKGLQSGINAAHAICSHFKGNEKALAMYDRRIADDYSHYLDGRAAYYAFEQRWPDADFWHSRHENITLHPQERLRAVATDGNESTMKLPCRLNSQELNLLAKSFSHPRAAHHVLAEFKASNPTSRPDRDVLLAMQTMISRGLLTKC